MNIEDMNNDEFYFYELEMNLSVAEENIITGRNVLKKLYGLEIAIGRMTEEKIARSNTQNS